MTGNSGTAPRIVAGVDGSESSLAALRWAVRQAELTGASVEAVIAWRYPVLPVPVGPAPAAVIASADFEKAADKTVTDAIHAVVGSGSNVQVQRAGQGRQRRPGPDRTRQQARTCSSSAAAGMAALLKRCSAR